MTAMTGGGRRRGGRVHPARVVAVAVLGVGVGLLGHGLGGGDVGGMPALVLPALLLGLAAGIVVSAVTWTAPRIAAALIAQQTVAHVLAWVGAGPTSTHPRLGGLVDPASTPGVHDHAALTPRMVVAHLVAAALFAVVLVPADRAITIALAWVRRIRLAEHRPAVPVVGAASLPRERHRPVPVLVHLCVMRGNAPPGALCLG
jgi:hypothetical protein